MITKHMFQFHNGTINTLPYDREANIPDVFQFHNGTINTTRIVRPAKPIACFNSTTVQLIPWRTDCLRCTRIIVSIPQRYN